MLDIIINPFITILLFLYQLLGGNVVLAIVLFTILVRLAIYPLTMKQQRSTKAMQEIQPELKKLQEKYKNDRERLAQAQWELYREYGVNPLAGCLPLLVQLPIMLALYRAIIATLAATPLQLLNLSDRLWVPALSNQVPLQNQFLWLNLAVPDPLYVLPVLVVATSFLQQRLLMPSMGGGNKTKQDSRSKDGKNQDASDQAAAISRQMMIIMPFMFGIFSISFASGLSIYFIVSNIIGIGQYAAMGRIDFKRALGLKSGDDDAEKPRRVEATSEAAAPIAPDSGSNGRQEAISAKASDNHRTPAPRKRPSTAVRPARTRSKRSGVYDSRAAKAKSKAK